MITTLQAIEPSIGQQILPMLQSAQHPPITTVLALLLNDLTTIEQDLILVLDDYHSIDSSEIDEALTFLLYHLPSTVTLVITTREDPQIPLAKYRARAELTEIRANELRFTSDEMSTFLNHMMGLDLSTDAISALETRTEGWIASLQMVAISLQGQTDKTQFIEAFTGSHRYIMDYLLEEVLNQQSQEIQAFLLQTSILSRLNADICDAITQTNDSQLFLEQLERSNLFIIPLDSTRQWFRYHHLFADALQARLKRKSPDFFTVVHQRAALWYEHHTNIEQAVQHYLKARDHAAAVTLIERVGLTMINNNQWAQLPSWLIQLPDTVIQASIVLRTLHAWYQFRESEQGVSAKDLQDIENALQSNASSDNMNPSQIQELQGQVATMRSYIALHNLEFTRSIELAHRALDMLSIESKTRGHNVLMVHG